MNIKRWALYNDEMYEDVEGPDGQWPFERRREETGGPYVLASDCEKLEALLRRWLERDPYPGRIGGVIEATKKILGIDE